MFHFHSSHSIMTRGSRFSRAPPHHTFPAFLNPDGRSYLTFVSLSFYGTYFYQGFYQNFNFEICTGNLSWIKDVIWGSRIPQIALTTQCEVKWDPVAKLDSDHAFD